MVRLFPKSKRYIDEIRSFMVFNDKNDAEKTVELYNIRKKLLKKRNVLSTLRIIFFISLYASIVSSFTNMLKNNLISGFLNSIIIIISILGTTFSVLMIFLLGHAIRNYDRDIATIESHIIAVYVKNDKLNSKQFNKILRKLK
ncbi:MAG: hypothetical protein QXL18_02415 [Candidatus Woesearchaeota archaeon]